MEKKPPCLGWGSRSAELGGAAVGYHYANLSFHRPNIVCHSGGACCIRITEAKCQCYCARAASVSQLRAKHQSPTTWVCMLALAHMESWFFCSMSLCFLRAWRKALGTTRSAPCVLQPKDCEETRRGMVLTPEPGSLVPTPT